ncbi:MAG: YihY/virulence factor BrkB family protein [Candidatus Dadabacteria bacterium]|nr:YihY/virulence factor BrkB family protein [Candidatus Dadabacteria bacterium]
MSKYKLNGLSLIPESYKKICELLDAVKPPGFRGISLLAVIRFFIRELRKDNIWIRSSAMAYHFFLALFPALIFLLTLIPYVPIHGLEINIEILVKSVIPPDIFELIWPTVKGIVSERKTGLLSLSFIITIYLMTQGVYVMMMAFNKDSQAFIRRNFFKERLIATLLVIIETLILLFAFSIHLLGTFAVDSLLNKGLVSDRFTSFFLLWLKWIMEFFIVFFGISFIYYFVPSVIKRWFFINPGSIIAFLLIILATVGFFYYVNNFANYNKIYGGLGAIVILMVWFYWISFSILIGFELNTSIEHAFLKSKEVENVL